MTFHLSTPDSKSKILISINVKCYKELVQYGAKQVLEDKYGPYIVPPEAGYDFSIVVDLENLPAEQGQFLQRAYHQRETKISVVNRAQR